MKVWSEIKILLRGVLFAVVAAAAGLLIGCSYTPNIRLAADEITVTVGESRDISRYVVFDAKAPTDKTLTLSSSDENIKIVGTTVRAEECGVAKVTVKWNGGSAELTVNVVERKPNALNITAENAVQTTSAAPTAVTLVASTDNLAEPENSTAWRVRGSDGEQGKTFTFTPSGYGEYTVTATLGELTATHVVKVYRPTTVTTTAREHNGIYSFALTENADMRNPRSVYAWKVNGVTASAARTFDFAPDKAGEYAVTLEVNGKPVAIGGSDSYTVSVARDASPRGKVSFDERSAPVIEWTGDKRLKYISIISPDGKRTDVGGADAMYSYLFADNSFRCGDFIEIFADAPKEYRIILGGEERGEFTFLQYPSAAKQYADSKLIVRNSFITDQTDCALWVWELYARGLKTGAAYIAYGAEEVAGEWVTTAAHDLGLDATVSAVGNVLTVEFATYISRPTAYENKSGMTTYSVLPHIEYSASNRRPIGAYFAIDKASRSVDVETSEQLLYAVVTGVKPLPKSGSDAERINNVARNMLRSIIGKDYSARQKVHAVYDWLQWQIVKSDSTDPAYCGDWLEGVFGSVTVTGTRTGAVSSRGAARSFALLCAIEGIPCAIERGGDGWFNKVELDGEWYKTDVFGGKQVAQNGTEMTSHKGLLICDEPDAPSARPAVDPMMSEYTVKTEGEVYFDSYISADEYSDKAQIKAAVYDAFDKTLIDDNIPIRMVGSQVTISNKKYGAQFMPDEALTSAQLEAVVLSIRQAAEAYAGEFLTGNESVHVNVIDNIVHLTVETR